MKKYMVKESQYKPLQNKIIGLEPLGGKDPVAHMSDLKAMENRIISAITISLKPVIDAQHETNSRLDRLEKRVEYIGDRLETVIRLNNLKTE